VIFWSSHPRCRKNLNGIIVTVTLRCSVFRDIVLMSWSEGRRHPAVWDEECLGLTIKPRRFRPFGTCFVCPNQFKQKLSSSLYYDWLEELARYLVTASHQWFFCHALQMYACNWRRTVPCGLRTLRPVGYSVTKFTLSFANLRENVAYYRAWHL